MKADSTVGERVEMLVEHSVEKLVAQWGSVKVEK